MLVGTFVEEVFSPIPAFSVLIPAGAAAKVQSMAIWYVCVLALLSGVGRVLGATVVYWLADKFEDIIFGKGRKIFGASHKEVEDLGKRLTGNSFRDWLLLFIMNAIPIFPGAFLSMACGFIKMRFDIFITATFAGTTISAAFFLYLGYFGVQTLAQLNNLELASQIVGGVIVALILIWVLKKYHSNIKNKASSRNY